MFRQKPKPVDAPQAEQPEPTKAEAAAALTVVQRRLDALTKRLEVQQRHATNGR